MASLTIEREGILDPNAKVAKQRNPFRRSQLGLEVKYALDGREVEVRGVRLLAFQKIFQERAVELDFISELAAVNVVELSNLPKDELADLWDDALRAQIECEGAGKTREGYLNRFEFFVLLSELQLKLGVTDEGFERLFDTRAFKPKPTRLKRNPFEDPASLEKKPAAASMTTETESAGNQDLSIIPNEPSDGFTEYAQKFGMPFLPPPSIDIASPRDTSKPLKSTTTDSKLGQKLSRDVALDHTSSVSEHKRRVLLAKPGAQAPELVVDTAMQEKESILTGETLKPDEPPATTVSQMALIVPRIIRPGLHEIGEPVSTSKSDKLALERLRALDPDATQVVPPKSKKRFSLMPFRKPKVGGEASLPSNGAAEIAASGFKLNILAQALQDAVTEGNLPLTASLIDLGADVNFISVKEKSYHHILGVAVATGHRRVIDYLISSGSNGASVDNALLTAYYTHSLDLLPKLVPHTDMYHLAQVDAIQPTTTKAESTSGSSLGFIARDQTMPRELRTAFLAALMADKRFDPNKIILRTYDLLNGLLYEYTTLTTLTHALDIVTLRSVLVLPTRTAPRVTSAYIKCPAPIQCLRPQTWKTYPVTTYAVLQLLADKVSKHYLNLPSQWPGEGMLSPLACAVSGGSLAGTKFYLSVGADPETLTIVPLDGGRSGWSYTVLGWAAFNGWIEICRVLVEAGATPWRTSMRGVAPSTPLLLACRGTHYEVVKYLLSLDVGRSMLAECLDAAVRNNDPRIVGLLLESGAPIVSSTWSVLLSRSPPPQKRHVVLEMLDLLLARNGPLNADAVLAAIDSGCFAGLSKILEARCVRVDENESRDRGVEQTDTLGFDKNAPFENQRWDREHDTDNRDRTCLVYAREKEKGDFVTLLKGYGWTEAYGKERYLIGNLGLERVSVGELVRAW